MQCDTQPLPDTEIRGRLAIPEYQRPYVWKSKELARLVRDLQEYQKQSTEDPPKYYMGSLILHHKVAEGTLNLIDGQQRLTTLLLWYTLEQETFDSPLQIHSPASALQIRNNAQWLANQPDRPRLDPKEINLTLVITRKEDDAYTFFETQNTGGVPLSGAAIIKSHHLRAIENNTVLRREAIIWEQLANLEYVIDLVAKARHWNYLNWRHYPSWRNPRKIKSTQVEEFTENSLKEKKNISYLQAELTEEHSHQHIQFRQKNKSVRQPLYEGTHSIHYFREMVQIYREVFVMSSVAEIPEEFYEFRRKLIKGHDGTIYLKELFELATLMYVNRFGYAGLYEFALWAFRYIYSIRVVHKRSVRENSIFKFVNEKHLLDVIATEFRHEEVISFLRAYTYEFETNNLTINNVKGRYVSGLSNYFGEEFADPEKFESIQSFDAELIKSIHAKLKNV